VRAAGLPILDADVPLFRRSLVEQLGALDAFLEAELDESPPPRAEARRDPGHRPTPAEDPYNAWVWKCSIAGAAAGALTGKTVSFKDHIPVAGVPLTFGCRLLEGLVPDFDATVVTRALEAGATIVGKNLLNGFVGVGGPNGDGDYGQTINPHAPDHVTGGSSGGSAAAVAAGEVDVSYAGDQGGSIRVPAAWCGVVGLKPTFGLVSHFGVGFGYDPTLDYIGPIARRVELAAAALDAVAGYDPLDPRQRRETPQRSRALATLDHGVRNLRIALLEEGFHGADPAVAAAVRAAADVLHAEGAQVERISVPEHREVPLVVRALVPEGARAIALTTLYGAFARTYYPSDVAVAVAEAQLGYADRLNPRTALVRLIAEFSRRRHGGRVYAKAQNVRPHYIRAYDRALEQVDVLLMPTTPTTAPRRSAPVTRETALAETLAAYGVDGVSRNTVQFNYTGHPALSVPCGRDGGLPIGMQLVGRRLDDALLLRIAFAFQEAVDWDALTATRAT